MAENKPDKFTEDPRKDPTVLRTRDELRKQPQIPVMLAWSPEDQKKFEAGKALPYPRVETVTINEVTYHLERGKMHQVPLSVACVLANARKISWDLIPDKIEGYGVVRDKQTALAEIARQEAERRARYAGIGEGLIASERPTTPA